MYASARNGPAIVESGHGGIGTPDPHWVLVLNKYQRDNLMALINAVGWGTKQGGIGDLALMNTGDWLGEIGWMLGDPETIREIREGGPGTRPDLNAYDADETGRPNRSVAELRRTVEERKP